MFVSECKFFSSVLDFLQKPKVRTTIASRSCIMRRVPPARGGEKTHKGDQQQVKSYMRNDAVILLVAFNEEAIVQVMDEVEMMLHGIKFEYI